MHLDLWWILRCRDWSITRQKFEFPTCRKSVGYRAIFSTHFAHSHEMLPYPLLVMCRNVSKCHVLENRTCRISQFWPSAWSIQYILLWYPCMISVHHQATPMHNHACIPIATLILHVMSNLGLFGCYR